MQSIKILGLDIGGVNIKYAVAHRKDILPAPRKIPFELFRHPAKLSSILKNIRAETKPDAVALTMTGELSDVFASRREGVRFIIDCAVLAFRKLSVEIFDTNGNLISPSEGKKRWSDVASANWMATAMWVAGRMDNCVIVDIGSTTTDIIPIINGTVSARGKTDFDRLKHGELLYRGYLRTNSAMACPTISLDGKTIDACPEYFSIVGDAHLYLGQITAKDYTCPAPDGAAKTKQGSAIRLARLVLSNPATIGEGGVHAIARQVTKAQVDCIAEATGRMIIEMKLGTAPIVLIGSGAIYKKWLSKKVEQKFIKMLGEYRVKNINPASCLTHLTFSCRHHCKPL